MISTIPTCMKMKTCIRVADRIENLKWFSQNKSTKNEAIFLSNIHRVSILWAPNIVQKSNKRCLDLNNITNLSEARPLLMRSSSVEDNFTYLNWTIGHWRTKPVWNSEIFGKLLNDSIYQLNKENKGADSIWKYKIRQMLLKNS